MNLRRTKATWEEVAKEYGYPSMRDLLYTFYVNRGYTTRRIAQEVLDISKDRVVQLIRAEGIPLRPRGGIH